MNLRKKVLDLGVYDPEMIVGLMLDQEERSAKIIIVFITFLLHFLIVIVQTWTKLFVPCC